MDCHWLVVTGGKGGGKRLPWSWTGGGGGEKKGEDQVTGKTFWDGLEGGEGNAKKELE